MFSRFLSNGSSRLGCCYFASSSYRSNSFDSNRIFDRVPIRGRIPPTSFTKNAIVITSCVVLGTMFVRYNNNKTAKIAQGLRGSQELSEKEFRYLRVIENKEISQNTSKIRFELDNPSATADIEGVANFFLVRKEIDSQSDDHDKGATNSPKYVVRPYTPVSHNAKGFVDFVVKRYDNGQLSPKVTSLKKGDRLQVKGPLEKFDFKDTNFDNVALIAGGTGITPMMQVAHKLLNGEQVRKDNRKVKLTLVYGSVTEEDILLKEDIDNLAAQHPDQLRVVYVVDKAKDGKKWASNGGIEGYMTRDVLKNHLPPPADAESVKVFVCGPTGMVSAICGPKAPDYSQGDLKGVLKDLGYKPEQVFKF